MIRTFLGETSYWAEWLEYRNEYIDEALSTGDKVTGA